MLTNPPLEKCIPPHLMTIDSERTVRSANHCAHFHIRFIKMKIIHICVFKNELIDTWTVHLGGAWQQQKTLSRSVTGQFLSSKWSTIAWERKNGDESASQDILQHNLQNNTVFTTLGFCLSADSISSYQKMTLKLSFDYNRYSTIHLYGLELHV